MRFHLVQVVNHDAQPLAVTCAGAQTVLLRGCLFPLGAQELLAKTLERVEHSFATLLRPSSDSQPDTLLAPPGQDTGQETDLIL